MKHHSRQKGFSLVEMIIYIFILVLLVLVLINTLRSIVVTYRQVKVIRTIETSAYSAMERMQRELRNGDSIDLTNSTFNSTSGAITFTGNTPTETSKTTRIYLEQGVLKIAENGTYKGQLTASSTTVTEFTLNRLNGTETEGVKIKLTLSAGSGEYARQENFYSTVLLRGTY